MLASLVGFGLTLVFWWPLYTGGGLMGGDIYTYFLPQKAYLAEHLEKGDLPLWNNRVGHGYPVVGESQTGVFYPFHLLYGLLDVNTAYNVIQLLHYVLAFLMTWRYARQCGLGDAAAMLAGLVYVYGWFPPRIVLEWAILGGTWLPGALWMVEQFLERRRYVDLMWLSAILACQMLAGHFHLAFISQLVILVYLPARLWWMRSADDALQGQTRFRLAGSVMVSLVAAFGLAAIQLAPTWELKQASQRDDVTGRKYEPGYGHMPFAYWSQLVTPWRWYEAGVDRVSKLDAGPADTNKVEAHLYLGLPTLVLLGLGLGGWVRGRLRGGNRVSGLADRRWAFWACLGGAALFYTPAWHLPVTRHLPGFGFFTGPGRYSIVTALAGGLLAGAAWQWSAGRAVLVRRAGLGLLLGLLFVPVLVWDLWEVSRKQTYAVFLETPLVNRIDQSEVVRLLEAVEGQLKPGRGPVRLFCDYQNLPTLMRVASTPVYLGLGPAEYFDDQTTMPGPLPFGRNPTAEQIAWLRRAGVTHVLSRTPLDTSAWPMKLVDRRADPAFLQVAYEGGEESLAFSLYELQGTRGRLSWLDASGSGEQQAEITRYEPDRVLACVSSESGGRVVLTDLDFPGWEVRIDGGPVPSVRVDGMFRGVDVPPGEHEISWEYRPVSIGVGLAVSVATLLVVVTGCLVGRRRFELGWRVAVSGESSGA